jgi:hypothetical protein
MKSRTWATCLACAALGFVLSGLRQPQLTGQEKAKESARTKWEYKITKPVVPDLPELEKQYNKLGDDGWELIFVAGGEGIFKRPKQ